MQTFSDFLAEDSDYPELPERVLEAFLELGDDQRGWPERAMLDVQEANGGGVLNFVVEHTGDLTHRMTHMLKYGRSGRGYVVDKAEKVLRTLKNPYGFAREHQENLKANAEYHKKDLEQHKKNVERALNKYAQEHSKLKVYNLVQALARDAAIMLGHQMWDEAASSLQTLLRIAKNEEEFEKAVRDYELDDQGNPVPWRQRKNKQYKF